MVDYSSDISEMPEDEEFSEDVVFIVGEDGEVTQDDGTAEDDAEHDDFYRNLSESMDQGGRARLADELIGAYESDKESRSDWERRANQGLELLGLKEIPDSELAFPGASSATYPVIAEAVVQFQSRTMPEIIPSDGPIKTTVIGSNEDENLSKSADNVSDYLNWRLLYDDQEWFDDTDQMLFYLPLGGSAFRKTFQDPITGKAKSRFVKGQDFVVPYKAKSLAGAMRYAHRYEESTNDIKRAMASGSFARIDLDESIAPEENDSGLDAADDRSPSYAEGDSVHELIEMHCYLSLDVDGHSEDFDLPYVVTIDKTQNDILSIVRNWREDDENYEKIVWFSHYKFLPGLGFYGFGFLHLIGGLAEAATGAMRGLLDAAIRSNTQGGFKTKDAGELAGDKPITPGVWHSTDMSAAELKDAFYTPPWPKPEPALYQLLGTLVEAAQRFTSTTDTMVGDANNNAPVGTTVALIEQGQKIFSAIHRRIHRAAGEEYRLFADLDSRSLGEDVTEYSFNGNSGRVTYDDFRSEIDILPVSDPNIFSQTQRLATAQALVQLTSSHPDIYGRKEKIEAHRRLLRSMNVPESEEILPDESVRRMDPVTENQYIMTGQGVVAFPDQDHQAHIQLHEALAAQLQSMQGPQVQQSMQALQAHVAEHYAYAYRQSMQQLVEVSLPAGMHPEDDPEELTQSQENALSRLLASSLPPVQTPDQRQAQQEQADASAEQKRKDAESQAEQRRKDQSFQAEERRKQQAFELEQRRKGVDFTAEEGREQTEWEREQARKAAEDRLSQEEQERARRADNAASSLENAEASLNSGDADE